MICFMFEASKKVFAPDPVNPPAARSPSEEMKRMTYLKKKNSLIFVTFDNIDQDLIFPGITWLTSIDPTITG